MRTPRIIILFAFFLATFTILLLSRSSPSDGTTVPIVSTTSAQPSPSRSSNSGKGFLSAFSFSAPLSLFPPNAIISLTDDNTTSFMARPAAFGPLLPARGLSGQLWIGSGFGDDNGGLRTVAGAEGELGCSDVPGYEGGKTLAGEGGKDGKGKVAKGKVASRRRGLDGRVLGDRVVREEEKVVDVDDGTDDHLHRSSSTVSKALKPAGAHEKAAGDTDHADIQSIQEGAEIAGKVVLLSRGGCGFLEKVKWVQRRGGIALIVGDDTRGGPLIQMYARGDTSNVTIPSVFTSHTTAHLLSSLIPPGTYIEDTIDENGNPAVKVQQPKKPKKGKKPGKHTPGQAKPTTAPKTHTPLATPPKKVPEPVQKPAPEKGKTSWFSSLFSSSKSDEAAKKGMLNWVLADEFDETDDSRKAAAPKAAGGERSSKTSGKGKGSPKATADDDFVIGVHDWRDPDLVGHPDPNEAKATKGQAKTAEKGKKTTVERDSSGATDVDSKKTSPPVPKSNSDLRGGSITPSSGKYPDGAPKKPDDKATKKEPEDKATESGLLHKLFGDDDDVAEPLDTTYADAEDEDIETEHDVDAHEGLWVTLTQTNGATPFFDTLLVLVVSPLVTLTVVYALLLLRSRIRRRRWRAPKSVVERLPVRTYQTVASSPASASRQPSPTSSSPSTPLLQQQQGGSTPSRPRPRSRTTSGIPERIPEPGNLSRSNSSNLSGNLEIGSQRGSVRDGREGREHEKAHVASEWKKYMGRQVECVVCLEEYVDGVSRVMSLPCGHEFHVDCITPWLTTRRRTCPICKGDVVRSLARGSGTSSPRYEPYRDDDEEDVQALTAGTANESPAARRPVSPDEGYDADLETGVLRGAERNGGGSGGRNGSAQSWRGWAESAVAGVGNSLGGVLGGMRLRSLGGRGDEEEVDRDR